MATITAPTQDLNGSKPSLWQAPVFVLGVTALLVVWFGRPILSDCSSRRIDEDLLAARQLIDRRDGNAEEALKHALAAQKGCEASSERIGEVAFLVGSAYVRLAEKSDPKEAEQHWNNARSALEQAVQHGVSDEDNADLSYRLAKVSFYLGDPLPKVIESLEESIPRCSTRAEGYRLLTEAYLRLAQPDWAKALAANQKLRDVAEATEAELTQAKLQGGEILLQMGKPEEARKSLEMISEQAPSELFVRARLLRARSYQEQQQWGEAVRHYNAALADSRFTEKDPSRTLYNLGLCYRQLDQPQEAIKAWTECARLSQGVEGAAAALTLAELRLTEQAYEPALELLVQSVARIERFVEWKNPLVDLKRAREIFERALDVYRKVSRHDLAFKLMESYAKLSFPRRLLILRGEIAAEWAREKMEITPRTADLVRQAEELYRLAGDSFARASELMDLSVSDQGEYLWLSARHFMDGKDDARAQRRLEQVVSMNLEPARLGEAWYLLSITYRNAGNEELALKAGNKCMEYDTPFAHRARHDLAMSHLRKGNLDDAEATLVFNLKMLRWESDPEALRESLFALGNLLFQRKDYRRVVRYLEDALGRFKDHPEVTQARYQLAESYRQIAGQANQSLLLKEGLSPEAQSHFQIEHRRWLQKAADEFALLDQILDSPEGKDHLPPELRKEVALTGGKCLLNVGQYDKALAIFEKVMERYEGKPEALAAAGQAVACHAARKEMDKVKQRLIQIKLMLPQMPDDIRIEWEAWLAEANKMLNEP